MDVCICAESAIELWRTWRLFGAKGLIEMGISPSKEFTGSWRSCLLSGRLPVFEVPSAKWAQRLLASDGARLSAPIDFLATESKHLSFSQTLTSRACPDHVGPTDIVALNEHIYVTAPELSLMEAARNLGLGEALRLINEFCGTFATNGGTKRGFSSADPLTSKESLVRFCDAHPSWRQARLFRKPVSHALDGCASPAESSTVLLLCLPVHDGGYGIPAPRMNGDIYLDAESLRLADRGYYVGDAVWQDGKTIVEYDSKSVHTDQDAVAHDYTRKLSLESAGYHVSVVTPKILSDPALFEKVALDTAKRVGHRHRVRMDPTTFRARQNEMRETLMAVPKRWYCFWNPTGSRTATAIGA